MSSLRHPVVLHLTRPCWRRQTTGSREVSVIRSLSAASPFAKLAHKRDAATLAVCLQPVALHALLISHPSTESRCHLTQARRLLEVCLEESKIGSHELEDDDDAMLVISFLAATSGQVGRRAALFITQKTLLQVSTRQTGLATDGTEKNHIT